MFKYQIELKEANSDEYTPLKSWARPFTDGTTLDETLDEGKINLSLTTPFWELLFMVGIKRKKRQF